MVSAGFSGFGFQVLWLRVLELKRPVELINLTYTGQFRV